MAAAAPPQGTPAAAPAKTTSGGGQSETAKRAEKHILEGGRSLILCNVKLSEEEVITIAPCIKMSQSLHSLSLFDSGLSVGATRTLCAALASQDSLTMLDLGHNQLGPEGVEAVCDAAIHNSRILTLGLASVGMRDQGAKFMADVVRVNCTITELYLNSNGIEREGTTELADALIFNNRSQIKGLYMFGNDMGEGVSELHKLLQEAPEAEENVPLSADYALAFLMGTHPRLGAASCCRTLAGGGGAGLEGRRKKTGQPVDPAKWVIRECVEQRGVKRTIYGLPPKPEDKK